MRNSLVACNIYLDMGVSEKLDLYDETVTTTKFRSNF
jgi:hypothetical protein